MRPTVGSQNPVLKRLYREKTPGKKNKYWRPILGLKTHQNRLKTAQKPLKIDHFSLKLRQIRINFTIHKNSPCLRRSEYSKRCFMIYITKITVKQLDRKSPPKWLILSKSDQNSDWLFTELFWLEKFGNLPFKIFELSELLKSSESSETELSELKFAFRLDRNFWTMKSSKSSVFGLLNPRI